MQFSKAALLVALWPLMVSANRLSSENLDLGSVKKIYVGPGLISVIEFPEDTVEVRVGAPQVFKVVVSPANARELLVQVTNPQPFSTNLVVRTVKRTFVFDLIPSTAKHQDLFRVAGAYGALSNNRAEIEASGSFEVSPSRTPKGKLVESGAIR
ncbi:MAG: hypothetical protein EOP05_12895 [Proteobacteria bacterium]|nr:MAG: hypothetical protein EOP05_12895 [Pseudomonadota bacterium]